LYSLPEENLGNTAKENIESANVTSSGKSDEQKVVVDLIEAIRAAERQQAESDAYIFAEEKRRLKVLFCFFSYYYWSLPKYTSYFGGSFTEKSIDFIHFQLMTFRYMR
jgi:hypothetical protein